MAKANYIWAEELLHEARADRKEKDILCSEVEIIDLMLEMTTLMRPVYENIDRVAFGAQHKGQVLLTVVSALGVIGTEEFRRREEKRDRCEELNDEISKLLLRLAEKFEKRDEIKNRYGLTGPDDGSIVDWVKAGLNESDEVTRFRGVHHLIPALESLQSHFFGSYWPSSAAMFRGMAGIQKGTAAVVERAIRRSITGYSGKDRDSVEYLLSRLDEVVGIWKRENRSTRKLKVTPTNLSRILGVIDIDKDPTTIAKAARRRAGIRNSRKKN